MDISELCRKNNQSQLQGATKKCSPQSSGNREGGKGGGGVGILSLNYSDTNMGLGAHAYGRWRIALYFKCVTALWSRLKAPLGSWCRKGELSDWWELGMAKIGSSSSITNCKLRYKKHLLYELYDV